MPNPTLTDRTQTHDGYSNSQILATSRLDLARAANLEVVTAIVRVAARRLMQSDGATIVLRAGDQCHYVDELAIAPLWKGHRFPMSECISGWVMQHKKVAAIDDIFKDPRVPHAVYRPTFVKSLLMVPIRQHDPIGAIGTYWSQPHKAGTGDVASLNQLADITADAIERLGHLATH